MKKIIPILLAITLLAILNNKQNEEYYIIPNESIRLRIIANSNTAYDQYIKAQVKLSVENKLKEIVETKSTIEEMREIINNNITSIEKIIDNTLEEQNYNKNFTISYGYHEFPEKEYKGVVYESGQYESLLITIGEGKGDNWWCVLFPPLCTMEVEEEKEVSYKFFIKELIDKYLLNTNE